MTAAQLYSAAGSHETLTLSRNEVEQYLLANCLGYDPRYKDGSYMDITYTARLATYVATVVRFLMQIERVQDTFRKSLQTYREE